MSRTGIISLLLFVAIMGYFLSMSAESTRKLQAGFYQLIAPFLRPAPAWISKSHQCGRASRRSRSWRRDNAALRVENRSLATNEALRNVEHEVNRLRHALNYRERSLFKLVPAEVITRDAAAWWRTVTINRGKEDGVEPEMPVLTDEGLVGKTTTVSANIQWFC